MWGATRAIVFLIAVTDDFNPRAPCGARPYRRSLSIRGLSFQSTRPVWGATGRAASEAVITANFNPRAPCGARRRRLRHKSGRGFYFNPRAPCGARPEKHDIIYSEAIFQSTRPVWGATFMSALRGTRHGFQSTRPVWGATSSSFHLACSPSSFQSTRPVWGATRRTLRTTPKCLKISIHAPRVGRDAGKRIWLLMTKIFQSTRPVWGATQKRKNDGNWRGISIHAPRVGRDALWIILRRFVEISIHAPRVGRDLPKIT